MRHSVRWLHDVGLDPLGALACLENRSLPAPAAFDRPDQWFGAEASR